MTVKSQIPFRDLKSFPELFATYCEDFQQLERFYAGNPFDRSALLASVDRTLRTRRNRSILVQVLTEQNKNWGADASVFERINELASDDVSVVVTGQQLGLFGGPLYTQYKTITTIQLAASLQKETGRPVVPVFWLAGEDHDFAEIAGTRLAPDYEVRLTADNQHLGPVGRIVLDEEISELLSGAARLYAGSGWADEIIDALEKTFRPGTTWCDAFARYLTWLFRDTGLVIVSGDNPDLKQLAAPLFEKAVVSFESLNSGIESTSKEIAKRFHAQLSPRSTNLFHLNSDRVPVDPTTEGFVAGAQYWSGNELLSSIRRAPQDFSPNVVLRPLYQDTILPTVAYVAGPGETAYLGQLKSAYEWAEIPMPIIYPRMSATIVEKNIARLLEKESVGIEDVDKDVERMFTSLVKKSLTTSIEDLFDPAKAAFKDEVIRIAQRISEFDPTLKKSALAIGSLIDKELGKLRGKVIRAEKQRNEVTRSRLARIVDNIYPAGVPQERVVAASYYIARYGSGIVKDLLDTVPVRTDRHLVLAL